MIKTIIFDYGRTIINPEIDNLYDVEKDRRPALKKSMKKTSGIVLAFANCCAIEIVGKRYRIISSKAQSGAYKVKDHHCFSIIEP